MADKNATIPRSLEEAKELAHQRMLDARARAESEDATPAPTQPAEDDEDESTQDPPKPSPSDEDESHESDDEATDEDDDEEDTEDDDDSEGSDDETEDDDDESDDDEDERKPEPKSEKRKPSRRSKRITKLQDEIRELRQAREQDEERLLQKLEQEQARRAALEQEKRQREAEDRALEAEMAEYLGSDDEYQAGIKAMMNGDIFEADKVRTWHERREIVGKLSRRAEARVNQKAAEIFWASTGELPGVDKKVLQEQDFGSVLKHLHAAGSASAQAEAKKEIAKLEQKVARLEAQLKTKNVTNVAKAKRSDPVEGGAPVTPRKERSIYEQAIDPTTRKIDHEKFAQLREKARASSL